MKPVNDFAWRPHDTVVLLLLQHLVQDRHQPLLELDVVVVRHQEISYPGHGHGNHDNFPDHDDYFHLIL